MFKNFHNYLKEERLFLTIEMIFIQESLLLALFLLLKPVHVD